MPQRRARSPQTQEHRIHECAVEKVTIVSVYDGVGRPHLAGEAASRGQIGPARVVPIRRKQGSETSEPLVLLSGLIQRRSSGGPILLSLDRTTWQRTRTSLKRTRCMAQQPLANTASNNRGLQTASPPPRNVFTLIALGRRRLGNWSRAQRGAYFGALTGQEADIRTLTRHSRPISVCARYQRYNVRMLAHGLWSSL